MNNFKSLGFASLKPTYITDSDQTVAEQVLERKLIAKELKHER